MHTTKARMNPWQLAMLLIPGIGSAAVLGLPSTTATFARQDAWMAPLVALPLSALTIWLCDRLAARFPEQTFAEYAPRVLGWLPGKLCGLLLFWYFFHLDAVITRQFADFLVAAAHPRTPVVLVAGLGGFAAAVAVRHGPEILARLGELFTPVAFVLVLAIVGLAYSSMDASLVKPVLENGWGPVLASGFITQAFTGQFVLLLVLLPSVNGLRSAVKASYAALIVIVATLTLVSFVSLSVFGPITASFVWPFFKVARVASFGAVLARIDPLVLGFWVGGSCLKMAVHLYAAVVTFAYTLGLRHWRPLVFPMAALMTAYAIGHLNNVVEHGRMLAYFWPPYTQVFHLALPALVLMVAAARGLKDAGALGRTGASDGRSAGDGPGSGGGGGRTGLGGQRAGARATRTGEPAGSASVGGLQAGEGGLWAGSEKGADTGDEA
ncbi:MAG TPA: endospore germination permease [Limnochordales bacterium]